MHRVMVPTILISFIWKFFCIEYEFSFPRSQRRCWCRKRMIERKYKLNDNQSDTQGFHYENNKYLEYWNFHFQYRKIFFNKKFQISRKAFNFKKKPLILTDFFFFWPPYLLEALWFLVHSPWLHALFFIAFDNKNISTGVQWSKSYWKMIHISVPTLVRHQNCSWPPDWHPLCCNYRWISPNQVGSRSWLSDLIQICTWFWIVQIMCEPQ